MGTGYDDSWLYFYVHNARDLSIYEELKKLKTIITPYETRKIKKC